MRIMSFNKMHHYNLLRGGRLTEIISLSSPVNRLGRWHANSNVIKTGVAETTQERWP